MPKYTLIYIGIISIISIIVTVYDKIAAKHNPRHRTRERTLFLLSVLGGSVAMYLSMKLIRHKTRHKRFMIGIPVIIILQVGVLLLLWYFKIPML
jgi:uncharacterized membrane protein YsdA (DUF1294 family)